VNEVRAWLMLEVIYFFVWLLTSALFLAYAYIVKFKSISKSEEIMKMDDNVWNDKNTDDFLRYLKFEYFLFNSVLAVFVTELTTGFIL